MFKRPAEHTSPVFILHGMSGGVLFFSHLIYLCYISIMHPVPLSF